MILGTFINNGLQCTKNNGFCSSKPTIWMVVQSMIWIWVKTKIYSDCLQRFCMKFLQWFTNCREQWFFWIFNNVFSIYLYNDFKQTSTNDLRTDQRFLVPFTTISSDFLQRFSKYFYNDFESGDNNDFSGYLTTILVICWYNDFE